MIGKNAEAKPAPKISRRILEKGLTLLRRSKQNRGKCLKHSQLKIYRNAWNHGKTQGLLCLKKLFKKKW